MWCIYTYIPGGHVVQTCFPSEEELVKVPRGHGRKKDIDALAAVFLNPEAKRTGTNNLPQSPYSSSTVMASSLEF